MKDIERQRLRTQRRRKRVFYSIRPKTPRPRLAFIRSNRYLSTQLIDDTAGRTLCFAATNEKSFDGEKKKDKVAARKLGELIASRARQNGIGKVFLDRRWHLYHGRLAEFSDAARNEGLEF